MLKQVTRKGYKFFGKYVHKYRHRLQSLAEQLKIARMPYTVEEYVAGAVLVAICVFALSFVFFLLVFMLLYKYSFLVSLISSLVLAVVLSALFLTAFIGYPKFIAKWRSKEINARLVFALTHMATMAGTGVPPIAVFKAIARFEDYGEIARECAFIVRDVEIFGKDIYSAIMDAARYSPSKLWSEVLWGIISTLRSGGDLRAYLSDKAYQLMDLHEREEKRIIETLNLMTEVFMVVFVLAPVVGVIMVVLMSLLGGTVFGADAKGFLPFLIYVILPIVGIVFLAIGELSKPKEVL